jgi:hypothetical protein
MTDTRYPNQGQQQVNMNKTTWDSLTSEDKKTWDTMSLNSKRAVCTIVPSVRRLRELQDPGEDTIAQEVNKTVTTPVVTPNKEVLVNKHAQ